MYCSHILNGVDLAPACLQCKQRTSAAIQDLTNAKYRARMRKHKTDELTVVDLYSDADELKDFQRYPLSGSWFVKGKHAA